MKLNAPCLFVACIFLFISSAYGIDEVCEQVLQAGEVRANQLAWHSSTEIKKGFTVEALKANGKFYSKSNQDPWKIAASDFDAAARKFSSDARKGIITISECKDEGTETVDGIDTTVISYHLDVIGTPPVKGKIYIGEGDGLPYIQTSNEMESHVRYKGVKEPKL